MQKQAQGSMEYLLIIGGAVMVAAVVVVMISGLSGGSLAPVQTGNTSLEGGYTTIQQELERQTAECGDDTKEVGEVCDGLDLAGESCASQGMGIGAGLACLANCSGFDTSGCPTTCGDGQCNTGDNCPALASTCTPEPAACFQNTCTNGCGTEAVPAEQQDTQGANTCDGLERCDGTGGCGTFCGNTEIENPNGESVAELCDGTNVGAENCTTLGLGFDDGTLNCNADCLTYDTSACTTCGNNIKEGTELCDGTDTGTHTCIDEGFDGGTIGCQAGCDAYDTSACTTTVSATYIGGNNCMNGVITEFGNDLFYPMSNMSGINSYGGELEFDLPTLTGATIATATLQLYQSAIAGTCTLADPIYLYKTSESHTTCSKTGEATMPPAIVAPDTTATPNPTSCATEIWVSLDITSIVQDAADNSETDLNIQISGEDISVEMGFRAFSHGPNPPTLEIIYN